MSPISLIATQDGAGDGWIALQLVPDAAVSFVGFHIGRLVACGPHRSNCAEVAVFGGADGLAEASGLLVSAGHAFVHGVFGTCLAPSCPPVRAQATTTQLLTRLSVALPAAVSDIETVCLENAVFHTSSTATRMASACAALTHSRETHPAGNRTGVALVKTCAWTREPGGDSLLESPW